MDYTSWIANGLLDAFLGGSMDREAVIQRGQYTLGEHPPWLSALVTALFARFGEQWRPQRDSVVSFIRHYPALVEACCYREPKLRIRNRFLQQHTVDAPITPNDPSRLSAPLPQFHTLGDLQAWLQVSGDDLSWLCGQWRSQQSPAQARHHYHYHWISKRDGSFRLLEQPKAWLKRLQQKIHRALLAHVQPHDAVHGFRRGRSCITYAQPHQGKDMLFTFDLREFFPSTDYAKVLGVFRWLGYPKPVAHALTQLTTHSTPLSMLNDQRQQLDVARYRSGHLPQGAPSSPSLANLAAWRLDCRLSGLAKALDLEYGRYADDGVLSGKRMGRAALEALEARVGAIALEEGYSLNYRKTKIQHHSSRQSLTNLVVNKTINVKRADRDTLKATLFNCIRYGPASQNRHQVGDFKAHLLGRVMYVKQVNPVQGAALLRLFEQIDWA